MSPDAMRQAGAILFLTGLVLAVVWMTAYAPDRPANHDDDWGAS